MLPLLFLRLLSLFFKTKVTVILIAAVTAVFLSYVLTDSIAVVIHVERVNAAVILIDGVTVVSYCCCCCCFTMSCCCCCFTMSCCCCCLTHIATFPVVIRFAVDVIRFPIFIPILIPTVFVVFRISSVAIETVAAYFCYSYIC